MKEIKLIKISARTAKAQAKSEKELKEFINDGWEIKGTYVEWELTSAVVVLQKG